MSDARASADALLTEHLRYTPLSLLDDIINTVNAIVYRALSAVEQGLLDLPPATLGFRASDTESAEEVKRVEIEDGVHRLETLLEATVDKNFDKLEIYALRSILQLDPELIPWVRLGHYKDLELPLPSSAATPSSIQELREKLHASQSLSLALESEAASTQSLLNQLKGLTQPSAPNETSISGEQSAMSGNLSFLANLQYPLAGAAPITENAAFAASQLPALRTLIASIRPALSVLQSSQPFPRASGNGEAARKARRMYVDSEAQRAVRGAVGLVNDDGESVDPQRGISASDVAALEAAMAARRQAQE